MRDTLPKQRKLTETALSEKEKINYDDFLWQMKISLEGFSIPDELYSL